MTDHYLEVTEVAARLHCSTWHVRNLIADGKLLASKPARKWIVPDTEVNRFIASRAPQRWEAS